jgi:uncharacterized protein YndB with AHSA1/START domain
VAAEPYRDSIFIEAEAELVFDYFVKPEALVRWMGDRAVLDPRPGGEFTLYIGDRCVEGRYVEVDRPRRIVITWGRRGSHEIPPSSSTLEVSFLAEDNGTRVSIVHTGLPVSEIDRHSLGWRHYLGRLRSIGEGKEIEPHTVPSSLTEGAD